MYSKEELEKRRARLSKDKQNLILKRVRGESAPVSLLPQIRHDPDQRYEPFPLTDVQQAYWLGRKTALTLGDVGVHTYLEFEADAGSLDPGHLNVSWQKLIERHEMLRAVVLPSGEQQILENVPPYEIRVTDMGDAPSEEVNARLEKIRGKMSHQVFSAEKWPLFEIRVTRFGSRIRTHLSTDALMIDDGSWNILKREWVRLYNHPECELPPLNLSFRDYVLGLKVLEDTDLYRRSRKYWFDRLDTLAPPPELPLAGDPASAERHFKRHEFFLDREKWSYLKQRAAEASITPSGLLLAAFSEVLAKWSKNPCFTINLTVFHRLNLHPDVSGIAGDFTLLLLVETDCSSEESFEARAVGIQRQLWQDMDHCHVGGVHVLRELSRRGGGIGSALMPVVFTSTLGGQEEDTPADIFLGENIYGISQTPQVWLDHRVRETDGGLESAWDVREEIFPGGLADDMFGAYCSFLERLAEDEASWKSPASCPLPTEQLAVIEAANDTDEPVSDSMLHTLFTEKAEMYPEKEAVVSSDRILTYKELHDRAFQVAHWLRDSDAAPNTLAAVVMRKGWEQVVAVMGILMSGAAYLPIDPELPEERMRYLIEQGGAASVLTQSALEEHLDFVGDIPRLTVDTAELSYEGELGTAQKPEDLAYVIYTSGSTGFPKGVAVDHRGAVNTVLDINRRFNVTSDDSVLGLSALNFDLSVYDIFGLLAAGGTIVLPDDDGRRDPSHWIELMERHRVTLWDTVPALLQMLTEYPEERTAKVPLRLAMMSGDWIPVDLPDRIRSLWPDISVIGMGGATEASIWSIYYPIEQVDPSWRSIPYGKALANQTFHVLDSRMEPRPVWVPGDLYIGGVGLAREYWRDEEKTRASFVTHPKTGKRLYRTGDLGRYLPDGNIEFLGREDSQVKIRGHRIELGEIQTNLISHPAVREAVVTTSEGSGGGTQLAAYVVADAELVPTKGAAEEEFSADAGGITDPAASFDRHLHAYLAGKLPAHMLPGTYVFLDALPLTPNGKIDFKALPKPDVEAVREDEFVAPRTPAEEIMAQIMAEVLGQERISVHGNFFELGGHSLSAVRVISKVQSVFRTNLSIRSLFEHPTVAGVTEALTRHEPKPGQIETIARLRKEIDRMSADEVKAAIKGE